MTRPDDDRHCRQSPGTMTPVIDRNRCEGKAACVPVCPHGVLGIAVLPPDQRQGLSLRGRLKGWAHGWRQAVLLAPERCAACGDCVKACPEDAITLARADGAPAPG